MRQRCDNTRGLAKPKNAGAQLATRHEREAEAQTLHESCALVPPPRRPVDMLIKSPHDPRHIPVHPGEFSSACRRYRDLLRDPRPDLPGAHRQAHCAGATRRLDRHGGAARDAAHAGDPRAAGHHREPTGAGGVIAAGPMINSAKPIASRRKARPIIKVTEIRSRKIASPVCRRTAGRVALSRHKSAVRGVRPDAPETRAPTTLARYKITGRDYGARILPKRTNF